MPKKRGRPPKKQMPAKRGRGRPRKVTQPEVQPRPRRSTRLGAAEAASATISAGVATPNAGEYTASRPHVVPVSYDEGTTPVFVPKTVKPHEPKFQLPQPRPDSNDFEAVVMALSRNYLPDGYVFKVYGWTLKYIAKRGLSPRECYKIVPRDILHFFVMIYYMGYCKLPAKKDYWCNGDDIRGDHPVCTAFGMTFKKFSFLWRNVYLMEPIPDADDDASDDEGELWYDEEAQTNFVVRSDSAEDDFHFDQKARSIIDLTNQRNKIICINPGHVMTIDEQMTRMQGRSAETYRMDNKPIPQGYKSFSIVDRASKFLWHMLPYGRKSTKAGTVVTVKFLVETLPKRGDLEYVVGMDNYFTHARALKHCLDAGVHAMGTARRKRGWPAEELKRVDDDRFNSLYYIPDHDNTFLTYRWVDNSVVTLVSTMHDPNASVLTARRRPRMTQTNKNHVAAVWGEDYVKDIAIPKVVSDYNVWKVGVDTFDQYLAYMMPDLRCRRTWMPLMIQALMTMRVNSYRAHTYICKPNHRGHKTFTLQWMRCLMRRASKLVRMTRATIIHEHTPRSPARRHRMSSKNPTLPEVRHSSQVSHVPVLSTSQGKCIYCRFLHLCAKIDHPDTKDRWPAIRQPQRKCIGCGFHLCKSCFKPYHA